MNITIEISDCSDEEMIDVVHSLHTGAFISGRIFRKVYSYGPYDALHALEELTRCTKQRERRAACEREAERASTS